MSDKCKNCGHDRERHFTENSSISPSSVDICDCCDHGYFTTERVAAFTKNQLWLLLFVFGVAVVIAVRLLDYLSK